MSCKYSKIYSGKANVQIYQYNGTGAQQWNVSFDEDGLYSFKNIQSGLMLGLSDGKAWYGANVSQQKKKDAASQKWIVTANGTLHAKWTPSVYNIIYKDGGDEAEIMNDFFEFFLLSDYIIIRLLKHNHYGKN